MQTKRKFLLSDDSILRALQRAGLKCRKIKIAWFYTSFYPEIYYIRQNDECSLHHRKEDLDRQTLNFKISKDDFKEALKSRVARVVQKSRYGFAGDEAEFWLELYGGELSTLVILRAKFQSEAASANFDFEKTFGSSDFCEITDDYRYKSRYLARYGIPPRSLDFAHARSVFEKFSRVKFFAPPYADSVKLAHLALELAWTRACGAKSEYQKSLSPEALHELRVQTRKTRALLKLSAPLFEAEKKDEILKLLAGLINHTNQLRDIHVFLKFLKAEGASTGFAEQLELIARRAADKILTYLNGAEFTDLSGAISGFLNGADGIYARSEYEKISKKFASARLCKLIKSLRAELKNLKQGSLLQAFHDARIGLKRLRYALEIFARSFDECCVRELFKRTKAACEDFGVLQDISVWQNFISIYQKASDKSGVAFAYLLALDARLNDRRAELEEKILNEKEALLRALKRSLRKIKAYE